MTKPIKVIDLFAGPGGLGEGFSSHKDHFKIAISIEKEASAHRTLKLRAFIRQFPTPPKEYYEFLKGNLGKTPEDQLYKIEKYKDQLAEAESEARCLTLGEDNPEIQSAIDKAVGKDDCILIGGPPCQAYSLAGRSRNVGIKDYKAEDDKRNFLYLEYLKVIARYQPKIYVMENVKGMLSAKINGTPIFESIRQDLQHPSKATGEKTFGGRKKHKYRIVSLVTPDSEEDLIGYTKKDPRDYIIRAEEYGIPQKRHRVILLGLREDIADKWSNDYLLKPEKKVTVKHVIDDLPPLRSGFSKVENTSENWVKFLNTSSPQLAKDLNKAKINEVSDFIKSLSNQFKAPESNQGKNLGIVKTKAFKVIKSNTVLINWYIDKNMDGYIINHETRGHLEKDLHRYLFSSSWAKVANKHKWSNRFPKSSDYPEILKPNHKNFNTGKFADRFRTQVEQDAATTITSHISKDGHYFIHYDPLQCRSLTVREAARIQTFPDNYFFVGNRTEQYIQVGNAVPPYLAFKISNILKSLLV